MSEKRGALFSQYATDADIESKGRWLNFGENPDGTVCRIRVARSGGNNRKYNKAVEVATRPHRRAINMNILPEDKMMNIMIDVLAETVVLEWEHVQDGNGVEIPFSEKEVKSLLKSLPDLYAEILRHSTDHKNYLESSEEDSGN